MFVAMEVSWESQRFGRFRAVVDGFVVAQVALVSERASAEPGWMVSLTGQPRVLDGGYATEFDAMAATEAALLPPELGL